MDHLNIIKLCVGAESVEDLIDWQRQNAARWSPGTAEHVSRMWPKRADEITGAGSLYWIIKGQVLARQRILRLEERRGADGIARCALVLDTEVIRTEAAPRNRPNVQHRKGIYPLHPYPRQLRRPDVPPCAGRGSD